MARRLRTYFTSIGFFDLAVAAPSMKAALEAWGVGRNLFQQGSAWETDEPDIVAAAMAKPGVVLKRAVGTKTAFQEKAELPTHLPVSAPLRPRNPAKHKKSGPSSVQNEKTQKAAIIQFEKERARREENREREKKEQAKQKAAEAREAHQRQHKIDRLRDVMEKAQERHESALSNIQRDRDALDRKSDVERRRWNLERERLEEEIEH